MQTLETDQQPLLDRITEIWCTVLKLHHAALDLDGHFMLQGGDSLQLARILARLRVELGVQLPLQDVASYSTPRRMTACVLQYLQHNAHDRLQQNEVLYQPDFNSKGELKVEGKVEDMVEGKADLDDDRLDDRRTDSGIQNYSSYPATAMQQGIWFAEQMGGVNNLYTNAVLLHFGGTLQTEALCRSFSTLLQCFPVLGSRFQLDTANSSLFARLPDKNAVELEQLEIMDCDASELPELVQQAFTWPFALHESGLCRAVLFRTGEQQCHLLLCCHHLVSDGWSGPLLLRALASTYTRILQRQPDQTPVVDWGFVEHAWREHGSQSTRHDNCQVRELTVLQTTTQRQTQSQKMAQADQEVESALQERLQWWRQHLAGAEHAQAWIWQHLDGALWPHPVQHLQRQMPAQVLQGCKQCALQHSVSLFIVMLTACKLALQNFSNTSDQILGIPCTERSVEEENSVGCFVQLLLSRTSIDSTQTVSTLLQQEAAAFHAASDRVVPVTTLASALKPKLLPDGNAWFSILFAYQNFPAEPVPWPNLVTTVEPVLPHCSQYALKLELLPTADNCLLHLEYAEALFTAGQIQNLADSFVSMLTRISA